MDLVDILVTLIIVGIIAEVVYWAAGMYLPQPIARIIQIAVIVVVIVVLLIWLGRNVSVTI